MFNASILVMSTDSAQVKEHSQHTIGVEFSSRTVKLGEKRIKLQVRDPGWTATTSTDVRVLQLWDTAGQERFR